MYAILIFAAAFFLSCTDISDLKFPSYEEVCQKEGYSCASSSSAKALSSSSVVANSSSGNSSPSILSSSSVLPSSSSEEYSSSSETYEKVNIGEQTWLKRNLNYNVGNNKCYNDSLANCEIYGRLYDWKTAMASSSDTINGISEKHKGICPEGWHIPSYDEWKTLIDEDTDGFAALPGGNGNSNGDFHDNDGGYWWSTKEVDDNSATKAYGIRIDTYNKEIISYEKNLFLSVRCIKDKD